jgi:hypothetical protein
MTLTIGKILSPKITFTVMILLFLSLMQVNSRRVIWDEVISHDRLQTRLQTFNEWYGKFNGKPSKVEARLTEDPNWTRIGLFAKEELKAEDIYLTVDRDKMIKADLVYQTPIGNLIKALEEQYGYDDYTNMLFYLLHEMNNKDSEWKPYLDLLPRQLTTPVFKYLDKKTWIEEELINTPVLSKIYI